jgi:adenylate kinase
MVERLMRRGRADDTEEAIRTRLQVSRRETEPVLAYFENGNRLIRIKCNDTRERTNIFWRADRRCLCSSY